MKMDEGLSKYKGDFEGVLVYVFELANQTKWIKADAGMDNTVR